MWLNYYSSGTKEKRFGTSCFVTLAVMAGKLTHWTHNPEVLDLNLTKVIVLSCLLIIRSPPD